MRQGSRPQLSHPFVGTLFLLGAALVAGSALLTSIRAWRDHSALATGRARWIWYSRDLTEPRPLKFYAGHDFLLDRAPSHALARIFIDRRGVLFVNKKRHDMGERRPGDSLCSLDVGPALHRGRNSIVVEAQSPKGPGGILFALDLPWEKALVSDGSWRVALSELDLERGKGRPALVWGRPPMWPWGYPRSRE